MERPGEKIDFVKGVAASSEPDDLPLLVTPESAIAAICKIYYKQSQQSLKALLPLLLLLIFSALENVPKGLR